LKTEITNNSPHYEYCNTQENQKWQKNCFKQIKPTGIKKKLRQWIYRTRGEDKF